jgi:hypothetical protein
MYSRVDGVARFSDGGLKLTSRCDGIGTPQLHGQVEMLIEWQTSLTLDLVSLRSAYVLEWCTGPDLWVGTQRIFS